MAASDASPAEPALTLDFVLGADSASVWALRSGEGASAGPRLAYVAGNVGVIYDAGTKKQTLLRGHRNELRAITVDADKRLIATACAGASASTVILWDAADGAPVGMIDAPHAGGTLAMAFTPDGRYLATLSAPGAPGPDGEPGEQEVGVWDCASARAAVGAPPVPRPGDAAGAGADAAGAGDAAGAAGGEGEGEGEGGAAPRLCSAARVPARDAQTSIAVAAAPPASPALAVGAAEPGREGGVVAAAWEMVTTGRASVVFWAVAGAVVRDTAVASRAPRAGGHDHGHAHGHGHGHAAGGLHTGGGGARDAAPAYPTRVVWSVAAALAPLPRGEPGRSLCASAFVPGARAAPLSTIDPAAVESKAAAERSTLAGGDAAGGASLSSLAAGAGATLGGGRPPSPPGGKRPGARAPAPHEAAGRVMLAAPVAARVTAVTATSEGTLLQWQADFTNGDVAAALGVGARAGAGSGVASAAAVLVRRSCLKSIKLAAPEAFDAPPARAPAGGTGGGGGGGGGGAASGAAAASVAQRINTVRVTPSGEAVVVGTEDGAVRVYDLNFRLRGWFEGLGAGPVTALDFLPGTTAPELAAALGPGEPQPGLPLKRTLPDVPDLVLATRRSLVLSLALAAFDAPDPADAARKGAVLLEGPDAPVTGLAAYPHAPTLLVAVASGVLQAWDTRTKTLLALRELTAEAEPDALGAPPPAGASVYHPSALAADALGRFIAVGTAEGFLLVLAPDTLADVQKPLPPPEYPRAGACVTRVAFSPDGLHLAAADAGAHVALYRFCRVASRRLVEGGLGQTTAAQRLESRKPWETVIPEGARFEDVVVDAWAYIGRVRAHGAPVVGLAFSALPPGARSRVRGTGASAVPGTERPAVWEADTADDEEIALRHARAGLAQLASVGADRKLCLFDVGGASVAAGLPVRESRATTRVEGASGARPTAAVWLPPRGACPALAGDYAASPTGASLVVASDSFKMRVWDCAGRPAPARTVLAPTFGGAVSQFAFLRSGGGAGAAGGAGAGGTAGARGTRAGAEGKGKEGDEDGPAAAAAPAPAPAPAPPAHAAPGGAPYALAYATTDGVVGVARLPLDGSPYGYVGVVGHAGAVESLAASADGTQIFSCGRSRAVDAGAAGAGADAGDGAFDAGGRPGTVSLWGVSEPAVAAASAEGGVGIAPFLSLLAGGPSGRQYSDICDLFSYAQIRAQGEASSAPRRAGVDLPVAELTAVMRGLGFFPTADAAEALAAEARAAMAELRAGGGAGAAPPPAPGGPGDTVDLQTLIRLFVNHRPVAPPAAADVRRALVVLAAAAGDGGAADAAGGEPGAMAWRALARALATSGDAMGADELAGALSALAGREAAAEAAAAGVPLVDEDDVLTPADVACKLLGLPPEAGA